MSDAVNAKDAVSAIIVENDKDDLDFSKKIATSAGLKILGEFETYHEAKSFIVGADNIDIAIIDISLEASNVDTDGADLIKLIKFRLPGCFTIAITGKTEHYFKDAANKSGADDFILRNDGQDLLLRCLKRVHDSLQFTKSKEEAWSHI